MKKLFLILTLILVCTLPANAAMTLGQLTTAYENGDLVYYAPQSYYDFLGVERGDLPGAPFNANTSIPAGKIDSITAAYVYDGDVWEWDIRVSVNGQTIGRDRLYISKDALKTALTSALTAYKTTLQNILDAVDGWIASITEIGVPVLGLTPDTLDFGTATTELTFDISNDGEGDLDYTITTSLPAKVTVNPSSGNCLEGESDIITVTVSRAGIAPGTYNPTVDIAGDIAGQVTLTVVVE